MTKIPERGECYIKPFPLADEQSIQETRHNLELVQVIIRLHFAFFRKDEKIMTPYIPPKDDV